MMNKIEKCLNELLVKTFHTINNIERLALKEQGVALSINEVHILEVIQMAEEPSMSKVAKQLFVTTGTLTTAIDNLVKKGYVIRYQQTNDRRKVLLQLTENAIEVLKIHAAFHNEMIQQVIGDMHLEENQTLIDSLERLIEYFNQKYHSK